MSEKIEDDLLLAEWASEWKDKFLSTLIHTCRLATRCLRSLVCNLPLTKEEVYAIAHNVCLSVSVSKITQKCAHGFRWNFACRQVSGNWKILKRKSFKQAPHLEQATGHRSTAEILFTPHCSPRAREFPRSAQLFCTTYGYGATGRQLNQFSDFGLFSNIPHIRIRAVRCCSDAWYALEWFYSVTRRNNFVGGNALHWVPF